MKSVMLFWVIDCFLARLASLLLRPCCTMIERGDTTWPAVVPTELSEAVKEYKKRDF